MTTIPKPTPGRIVWYQNDGRNYSYYLPALVVVTTDNLVREAVAAGVIPDLSSAAHVHLWVPGGLEAYREFDVPFDGGGKPRSWRYPDQTREVIEVGPWSPGDPLRVGVEVRYIGTAFDDDPGVGVVMDIDTDGVPYPVKVKFPDDFSDRLCAFDELEVAR